MKKFEYLIVNYAKAGIEAVQELGVLKGDNLYPYKFTKCTDWDELGSQGWELVSLFNTGNEQFPFGVFKREVV